MTRDRDTTSSDFEQIQGAVSSRTLLDRIKMHAQYRSMYNPALEFVKDQNLLIYGGYALNSILPDAAKFYDIYELPDLDCFSPTPAEHAQQLANIYVEKGYAAVEVSHGMHVGTFKLAVDLRNIVDFKYVPKSVFDRFVRLSKQQMPLIKKHVPNLELLVAPLDFLRYSIHHEISEPNGNVSRWRKVYERFLLLHKHYPFCYNDSCLKSLFKQYTAKSIRDILETLATYIQDKGLPSVGCSAFVLLLRETGHAVPRYSYVDPKMGYFEVLADSAMETLNDLQSKLQHMYPKHKFTVVRYGEKGDYEHNVPSYTLFYQGKHALVTIHQTVSCHSITKIANIKVGNVDTIIRFLFHYIFNPINPAVDNKKKCMINILYNLVHLPENRKKTLFSRFNLDCYGYQASLNTLRRARSATKRTLFKKTKDI